MEHNSKKNHCEWKYLIVSLLLVAVIVLSIVLLRSFNSQKVEMCRLNAKINIIFNSIRQNNLSVKNDEISLYPYYTAISEKMDNTISEIITLVTIIMGISTASGLILAFKAPRDIEREIGDIRILADEARKAAQDSKSAADELNSLVNDTRDELSRKVLAAEQSSSEANKSAKEAKKDASQVKFEVELKEAISEDSDQQKIEALIVLERKYKNEKMVFVHKGRIAHNAEDAKVAFDEALKLGYREQDYYNELAHSYYNVGDYDQAIEMIKKGLGIEKSCWLYVNLARTLCSKSECNITKDDENFSVLAEALIYLDEAEKLNSKDQQVYLWRARIYNNIIFNFTTEIDYADDYITSVDKAYEIDSERAQSFFVSMEFDICKGKDNYKDDRTLVGQALLQIANQDCQHMKYFKAFQNLHDAFYAFYLPAPRSALYKFVITYTANVIAMFSRDDAQMSLSLINSEKDKLFLEYIQTAAIDIYKKGRLHDSGKVFAYLYIAFEKDTSRVNTIVSLIYMMRRGEIKTTNKNIEQLVRQVKDSKSIFAQINIYLWSLQFAHDEEARKVLLNEFYAHKYSKASKDSAIKWWSDIVLVGADESARVLEMLSKINETT